MQTDKIKTYVLFPKGSSVENTQRFWAAKARIIHEGKIFLEKWEIPSGSRPHSKPCPEIIVLAYKDWEKDLTIQKVILWADQTHHPIRLVNPSSWKDLVFTQKILARRNTDQQKKSQTLYEKTIA